MPRTARLARHGVAAYDALWPTSDGDLQQTGRTGPTQAPPRAASFDCITVTNQKSQGERAPSRRPGAVSSASDQSPWRRIAGCYGALARFCPRLRLPAGRTGSGVGSSSFAARRAGPGRPGSQIVATARGQRGGQVRPVARTGSSGTASRVPAIRGPCGTAPGRAPHSPRVPRN
jgi:hypothetical protein